MADLFMQYAYQDSANAGSCTGSLSKELSCEQTEIMYLCLALCSVGAVCSSSES